MKIIYLWAIIIGVGSITGFGILTNNIDVNSGEIGIFDFVFNPQQFEAAVPIAAVPIDAVVYEEVKQFEKDETMKEFMDDSNSDGVDKLFFEYEDFEGCSVSFWGTVVVTDNHDFSQVYWPQGYLPDDKYGYQAYFNEKIKVSLGDDPTLDEALQTSGDGINKLARQSVAALLNSADKRISYPLSIGEIISKTQKSIQEQEYTFADELATYNNLGKADFCKKVE